MLTVSGKISLTQVLNGAFLVLWFVNQIAGAFGYASYEPPIEALVIAPAIIAIINMLIRKYRTKEPLA